MAWTSKPDYFGLEEDTGGTLKLQSSDENASAQEYDAQNDKGDVVTTVMFGKTAAPTCTYVLASDTNLSSVQLGQPTTHIGNDYYTIGNITVNTAAAQPPTVTVTGMLVPSTGNPDCYYNGPSTSIKVCHHAQDLFGLGIASQCGTNNYLTQANYTIEGGLTSATVDGEIVAYDITGGKVTANVTVQAAVTNATAPTYSGTGSAVSDWKLTSPWTRSDPDAALPTFTATFTKGMVHATPNP